MVATMRFRVWFALALLDLGCADVTARHQPTALSGEVKVQAVAPVESVNVKSNPSPQPIAEKPTLTREQQAQATTAFGQALELWSNGRAEEASAMVDLALNAMGRKLPEDRSDEGLHHLAEHTVLSADGRILVVGDKNTLYVCDAASGFVYGLKVHDFGHSEIEPGISPKGTYVVAPSSEQLIVYETKGLVKRTALAVRSGAPFAFIDDEHIVTVRLGAREKVPAAEPTARQNYVVRELSDLKAPRTAAVAEPSSSTPSDAIPTFLKEEADDEMLVMELPTGKVTRTLKLNMPPDQGLLRRVASLPRSEDCSRSADCERFAFNPVAIGRRVDSFKVGAGMISAIWRGGSVSLHRVRDGKLIGSFRSRGENWKPGLVAVVDNPPRAAVATSTLELGRGNEPPFSVTALVDLKLGKVVQLIDDCRWATGLSFSLDGKSLMVGDLRKACLHDAITGRLLETTEEVRPSLGPQDELQDVEVRPLRAGGRWLVRTADGAFGVFEGSGGKALLRGKQEPAVQDYVAADDQSLYVADYSMKRAELVTLGPTRIERRILRLEELEQKQFPPEARNTPEGRLASALEVLALRSCLIEGFRLPGELCRLATSRP
jgi:hypothetical protein